MPDLADIAGYFVWFLIWLFGVSVIGLILNAGRRRWRRADEP